MKNSAETLFVTCARGSEIFLHQELLVLGHASQISTGGCSLRASVDDCIRLNLRLRTAHRVLFRLHVFRCRTVDDFYAELMQLPFERWVPEDGYFSVHSSAATDCIRDTRFLNRKTKDAIVDRLRRETGARPDSGPSQDRLVFFVHWNGSDCKIYLDTSGTPLSHRGYRRHPGSAPLRESLAASIVLASGWKGLPQQGPLMVPMCGSGTLAIEAALIARNIAPGLLRGNWSFLHSNFSVRSCFETELEKCENEVVSGASTIFASDSDKAACDMFLQNIPGLVAEDIRVEQANVLDLHPPERAGQGTLLLNPPYGERIGEREALADFYHQLGRHLKARFDGWEVLIIGSSPKLMKQLRLKPEEQWTLFNGALECRLARYTLYTGSR